MDTDLIEVSTIAIAIMTAIPAAIASFMAARSRHAKDLEAAQHEYNEKLITQNKELQTQIDELKQENKYRKDAEQKCEENLRHLKNVLAEQGILKKYDME